MNEPQPHVHTASLERSCTGCEHLWYAEHPINPPARPGTDPLTGKPHGKMAQDPLTGKWHDV